MLRSLIRDMIGRRTILWRMGYRTQRGANVLGFLSKPDCDHSH